MTIAILRTKHVGQANNIREFLTDATDLVYGVDYKIMTGCESVVIPDDFPHRLKMAWKFDLMEFEGEGG